MNEEIDKAIESLTKTITRNIMAGDALKLTQAALNLAHVKAVLAGIDRT